MKNKNLIYIIYVILFSAMLIIPNISAIPHTIYGYAYYEDNKVANNATINVINQDTGEQINLTVSVNGAYQFDCGDPGLDWQTGDTIKIIINQTNPGKYLGLEGEGNFTVNREVPFQEIDDIILYGLEGDENPDPTDNKNDENGSGLNLFIILLIFILIIIISIFIIIYRYRK